MQEKLGPFDIGRAFIKAVDIVLEEALLAKGFHRLRKLEFVHPIDDEFDGWLGLNRNNKYASLGEIGLSACWGIHCRTIQRLKDEWAGTRYRRGSVCTVPLSWGEEQRQPHFEFKATGGIEDTATAVAEFYRREAGPVMMEHASYPGVIPSLEKLAPGWGGWDESLLLAYSLGGFDDQAQDYARERANECAGNTTYSEYYLPFLEGYRQTFGK